MNRRMIARIIGIILLVEGGLMMLPAIVAIIYREWEPLFSLLGTAAFLALIGFLITRIKVGTRTIHSREGQIAVSLGWIALSIGGALPFFVSGEIPSLVDACFETVSGFTTTGASILNDIESMSKSLLFWRSFTHWIGGMGFLVFVMAALPLASGGGNIHLMRAESPGLDVSKLVPSSRGTALRLYYIYFAMTVAEVILLLCCGNPLFDSLTLSFGTAGTGGFAIKNSSVMEYNTATQIIVTVFMSAFGVNFSCYYLLLSKKIKTVLKNEELRAYFIILIISTIVVTINILNICDNFGEALKHAAFQVSSVMTTTGFATMDFDKWPEVSRMTMIVIMCIGACVGSTGGGIKVARIIILSKEGIRQLRRSIVPNRVESVRLNGKVVSQQMISSISGFFIQYMIVFVFSVLALSFDTKDTVSNVSGVVATLNNIGPGLGIVGASGNFESYSIFSKLVFIFDMLVGRLELLPVLALFSVRTWHD